MLLADLRPAQGGQKLPAQRRCKEAHLILIFCESRLSRYHGESRTPPPKTARLSQRCSCNATTQRSSTFIVGLGLVGSSLVSSSTWFVWFKLQVSLDSDLWNAYELLPSCGLLSNIKCCQQNTRRGVSHLHAWSSVVTGKAGDEDNCCLRVCLRYFTQQNGTKQMLGSNQSQHIICRLYFFFYYCIITTAKEVLW